MIIINNSHFIFKVNNIITKDGIHEILMKLYIKYFEYN